MCPALQSELLQWFYETTLEALQDARNDRLWFKTNTKVWYYTAKVLNCGWLQGVYSPSFTSSYPSGECTLRVTILGLCCLSTAILALCKWPMSDTNGFGTMRSDEEKVKGGFS